MFWIDSHCHLTAPNMRDDIAAIRQLAAANGVRHCVIPAASCADLALIKELAAVGNDSYAIGIHPLYLDDLPLDWLQQLQQHLERYASSAALVALGEIGLDYFVPQSAQAENKLRQQQLFVAQLELAQQYKLPVIVHTRRSADAVLQLLKKQHHYGGIAHAFNGSLQQAKGFIDAGFKLGFGGALTYERANKLRNLAKVLPLESLVIETDSPDMPPQWLYVDKQQRLHGKTQPINTPAQLPAIAAVLAELRQIPTAELARQLWLNSCQALNLSLPWPGQD